MEQYNRRGGRVCLILCCSRLLFARSLLYLLCVCVCVRWGQEKLVESRQEKERKGRKERKKEANVINPVPPQFPEWSRQLIPHRIWRLQQITNDKQHGGEKRQICAIKHPCAHESQCSFQFPLLCLCVSVCVCVCEEKAPLFFKSSGAVNWKWIEESTILSVFWLFFRESQQPVATGLSKYFLLLCVCFILYFVFCLFDALYPLLLLLLRRLLFFPFQTAVVRVVRA